MGVAVPVLQIRLLGGLDLRYGTERIESVDTPRLQSLLAYLLLHRSSRQLRQHLAFLLWPDSSEAQARTNLRQLLHHLRRALPEADRFLEVDHKTIRWRDDAPFSLDVVEFERATERAERGDEGEDVGGTLKEAVDLYRGDLLPDCYDEWLLGERERLRQGYVSVLERLTTMLEAGRDYAGAIRHAELLLRADPLHEGAYRRLMRLYERAGERARALRVFHTCASILERELGAQPSRATCAVYESLLRAEDPPTSSRRSAAVPLAVEWPMIGRREEWARALAAWRQSAAGCAQLLIVRGDAGIGKTRLVHELAITCSREGITTSCTRSYAAEGRLAYAPVAEWLRSDAVRRRLSDLDDVWLSEVARLLPELLSEHPELGRPEPLTDAEQRLHFFEALARALLFSGKPLLLVIDDLQWADQQTLEFLHYLVRFDAGAPLLVAATARAEEITSEPAVGSLLAALSALDRLIDISLGPLTEAESLALAAELRDEELGPDIAARLYRETEGNPLFLVETIRAGVAEEGRALPPKVQSVIEARLAQLSPTAREVIGVAAVVGREFTFTVLREAGRYDEDVLVLALDELWRRRIVREQGSNDYDFHHDKIREVAYLLESPARRSRLHAHVAGALERMHASDLRGVSGQIAAHFERAGMAGPAVSYYARAAEVSQDVFANDAAVALLSRALELLATLPQTRERDERELELRTALGCALVAVKGYGSPDVEDVYAGARAACERLQRTPTPPILRGLALTCIGRGDFQGSHDFGHELLAMGELKNDGLLMVEGHYVIGVTQFWRGHLTDARRHLEDAVSLYRPDRHREHVWLFAQDPKIVCLSRLAYTLWYLGYPDRALEMGDEAVALAQQLAHPLSLGYALNYTAWLNIDCRREPEARRLAAAAREVSQQKQLGFFRPMGIVLGVWMQVQDGEAGADPATLREAVAVLKKDRQQAHFPYGLVLVARAYLSSENLSAAREVVTEGLTFARAKGHGYLEAEFHRLEAEILLGRGATDAEVESAFARALEVSRRQAAKSLELRAALSQARWRARCGPAVKRDEAARVLADVYGWFSEGHDTADLREAKELLGALSRA